MSGDETRTIAVETVAAPPEPPARPVVGQPAQVSAVPSGGPIDFVESFLREPATQTPDDAPGGSLYDRVLDALKNIFDPEIPVNIYDLGLIYGLDIDEGHVDVTMTLTTPHCPVAESMPGEVETRVGAVPGVGSVTVSLVWDPPWDPQKMSDEAKLELGML
ncbi:SUF system Fe-S cluster assembly protein [Parapedomonas caeni]